jgi:methyl-accepting chemotaxis protein
MIEAMIKQVEASFSEMSALNEKSLEATSLRMQISIGLIILLLAIIVFFVGRSVSRPLKVMTNAMGELANGNLDVELPGLDRKDEIGDMAVAVDRFRIRAAERAQQRAEDKRKEDERLAGEHRAAMIALADQFEGAVGAIVERVSQASTELEACSGALSQTAQTTQQLTMTVTAASEQASANVESVAGATEEMSSSVNEISRQVHESSRIANEAVAQASKTDSRIAELSQAATRIGDVVALITAIAEQTNLLALNATIEAARAGDAGRGFAVVASEVKQLASQTAKATEEIGTQVASMQTATSESVAAIKEIGGTIGRISEIATAIASAVEEQDSVTKDIARNVQQAAAGTSQVVSHIGEVNRGAAETGAASGNLLTSAQSLSGESNRLKSEVEKFLATVRAA